MKWVVTVWMLSLPWIAMAQFYGSLALLDLEPSKPKSGWIWQHLPTPHKSDDATEADVQLASETTTNEAVALDVTADIQFDGAASDFNDTDAFDDSLIEFDAIDESIEASLGIHNNHSSLGDDAAKAPENPASTPMDEAFGAAPQL